MIHASPATQHDIQALREQVTPAHGNPGTRFSFLCLRYIALGIGTLPSCALYAQVRPDAGQTLESIRPAPAVPEAHPDAALPREENRPAQSAPDGQRITVKAIHISGARAFPEARLQGLVQDAVGKDLNLDELNALARRITDYYRARGYLLTRAYLPAQEVTQGRIEIAVLEGRIAGLKVDNTSRLAPGMVDAYLGRLQSGQQATEGAAVERSLLLLDDLPGVEVRSTLGPGATVGTADLGIQVQAQALLSGSFDADNTGNRYTGEYRAGATLNVNNPSGYGDLFSLRLLGSGPGLKYARAAWQAPLGGTGLKGGLAYSDLRYRLGRDFEALGAHGSAQVATAWAAYPLIRSLNRNLNLQLSYDDKRLNDLVDVTASNSNKKLGVWTFGLSGDHSDSFHGGGISIYNAGLTGGRLRLDAASLVLDQGAGGHQTGGNYTKLTYSYMRLQHLGNQLSFYANLSGQAAGKNLDSSEKLSLGGAYGVRAYPQGEAAGDDAVMLNLELRWSVPGWRELRVLGFFDAGTARINHNPLATDSNNNRHLLGEGVGLQWNRPNNFALNVYLAWRAGAKPASDSDRNPRLWVQAAKYF